MISADAVAGLAEHVRIFDVEQRGWKFETHGPDVSAQHALSRLVEVIFYNDFSDVEQVEPVVAPESVIWAMRFARWGEVPTADITAIQPHLIDEVHPGSQWEPLAVAPGGIYHLRATMLLSGYINGLGGTAEERELTRAKRSETMAAVAQRLMLSADEQAAEYSLQLPGLVHDRLTGLREYFGIPEPRDI